MRIDDSFAASNELQSAQLARTEQLEQEQVPRERESGPQDDSVSLSNLGSALARAIEGDSGDVVRRVDETQQAINNGTFHVPPEQVADALIEEALNPAARGPSSPE